MLKLYLIAVLTVLSFFTLACGDSSSDDKKSLNPTGNGDELSYELEEECDAAALRSVTTLGEAVAYQAENGEAVAYKHSLENARTQPSLQGNFVKNSFHGFVAKEVVVDNRRAYRVVEDEKPFTPCRSSGHYERLSVEGIGVTGFTHLENFFRFYDKVRGRLANLPKLNLYILAKLLAPTSDGYRVETDNLSYIRTFGDNTAAIIIHPKSDIGVALWPKVNLWESSWIIAHEGSHHLFSKHFDLGEKGPLANTIAETSSEGHPILDPRYLPQEGDVKIEREAGEPRAVTGEDVTGALNEGFADLFGFYAVGEERSLIANFECFSEGRDPLSSKFKTGEQKAITQTALAEFGSDTHLKRKAPSGVHPCNAPHYQDIHVIGAVIVYGLNQLMEANPNISSSPSKTYLKAERLLQWVEDLGKSSRLGFYNWEDALSESIALGVRKATSDGRTLNQSQCAIVRTVFPAFAERWIGSHFFCQ